MLDYLIHMVLIFNSPVHKEVCTIEHEFTINPGGLKSQTHILCFQPQLQTVLTLVQSCYIVLKYLRHSGVYI